MPSYEARLSEKSMKKRSVHEVHEHFVANGEITNQHIVEAIKSSDKFTRDVLNNSVKYLALSIIKMMIFCSA
jgi:hypothetical protein